MKFKFIEWDVLKCVWNDLVNSECLNEYCLLGMLMSFFVLHSV